MLLWVFCAAPCVAAAAQTLTYVILKDGEPIGQEHYVLNQDGPRLFVTLSVASDVKVLFLDFHYRHERSEVWNGKKLEQIVADTDDDGSHHHVEAHQSDNGLRLLADNREINLPSESLPIATWTERVVERETLFSVENGDAPYKVTIKRLGQETLKTSQGPVPMTHYVMSGDVERDLWYGLDGILAKMTFRRRGFGIAVMRNDIMEP